MWVVSPLFQSLLNRRFGEGPRKGAVVGLQGWIAGVINGTDADRTSGRGMGRFAVFGTRDIEGGWRRGCVA